MEVLYCCETSEWLLFTAQKGGPLHYRRRRTFFDKAPDGAGLQGLKPHDLRRTYATLSIQEGVRPKALQAAMAHSDIRLTKDTYAGVFELDEDDHAARLSAAAEKAPEEKCSQNVRSSRPAFTSILTRGSYLFYVSRSKLWVIFPAWIPVREI